MVKNSVRLKRYTLRTPERKLRLHPSLHPDPPNISIHRVRRPPKRSDSCPVGFVLVTTLGVKYSIRPTSHPRSYPEGHSGDCGGKRRDPNSKPFVLTPLLGPRRSATLGVLPLDPSAPRFPLFGAPSLPDSLTRHLRGCKTTRVSLPTPRREVERRFGLSTKCLQHGDWGGRKFFTQTPYFHIQLNCWEYLSRNYKILRQSVETRGSPPRPSRDLRTSRVNPDHK